MRRSRFALAALILGTAAAVLLSGPTAFAQSVKADFDKKTDFTKYKTFAFKKGTDAPTPFAQERIEAAIAAQLKARGMTPSETPDTLVYTHTKLSKEQRVDVS
jgi:hypothetical protein